MNPNDKFYIDYEALYNLADNLKDEYQKNPPYPNCFIDNFFPSKTYANICATFPDPNSEIWKTPTNQHTIKKSVTKRGHLGLKEMLFNEDQRRVFMELNSSLFIHFLEKISGINGLIPDPYFAEGSYAMSRSNGMMDIHADFSHHDIIGLERRINIIIYFNDTWLEEYDGALNLYDKNLNIIKRIFPFGNRVAIFTTSPDSFHGFPELLKCPSSMERRSINMYYYTIPRDTREIKRIYYPTDPNFIPVITNE
jgi:Rps23 Pro-64 3,4-dihydroxylase Tpa1-like proline 4-hydroxylase